MEKESSRKQKPQRKGLRCVAFGCSNSYYSEPRRTFHRFPNPIKEQARFSAWVNAVKRTRAKWNGPKSKDTSSGAFKSCVLCSDHFDDKYHIPPNEIQQSLGFRAYGKLTEDAIPTKFFMRRHDRTSHPKQRTVADKLCKARNLAACSKSMSMDLMNGIAMVEESEQAIMPCSSSECEDVRSPIMVSKCFQARPPGQFASKRVQVSPKQKDFSCQVGDSFLHSYDIESSEEYSIEDDIDAADEYLVDSEEPYEDSDDEYEIGARSFVIVQKSKLLNLFTLCPLCSAETTIEETICGTLLTIQQKCCNPECDLDRAWKSQQQLGRDVSDGNLAMSSAIFLSGTSPTKALRMFQLMGLLSISYATFLKHQKKFIIPSVQQVYSEENVNWMAPVAGQHLILSGDVRADSPGHNAKYMVYSLMDSSTRKVLCCELVQSNETGGSTKMEKEGLKRCLASLTQLCSVKELVTDRHPQIRKYLHEMWPNIKHSFDTWHIAKGLKKKLTSLSKKKDCGLVALWQKSLVAQLYFCARRGGGDAELNKEVWNAVSNHIVNEHEHPDNTVFRACEHGALSCEREWFKPDSTAYVCLTDVLYSKTMMRDIIQLSGSSNTSGNETFNALINHFAPKMYHFHFSSQQARMLLAALHFYENSQRQQRRSKTGEQLYAVKYVKYKKDPVVHKILTDATYGYCDKVKKKISEMEKGSLAEHQDMRPQPPTLASSHERVERAEAIAKHKSRYSSG